MMICCKNLGYIIFAGRYSYMGDFWYTDVLKSFEKKGRIRAIDEDSFFKYDKLMEAVGKFSKTPSKVYVYQKTEEDSILVVSKKLTSSTSFSTADGGDS
jgi:hypothetical protein